MPETEHLRSQGAGVSEFELPDHARVLAAKVLWELFDPCRRGLASADSNLAAAIASAQSALDAVQARSATQAQEHRDRLRLAQRQADAAETEIAGICEQTSKHVNPDGRNDDRLAVARAIGGTVPLSLDMASLQAAIAPVRASAEALLQARGPAFWPASAGGRSAILLSSLLLLWVYYPLVLAWPAIVLAARLTLRSQSKANLDGLIEAGARLIAGLAAARRRAEGEWRNGLDRAAGLIPPAVEERDLAVERAHHHFKEQVEEVVGTARARAAELHLQEGLLWAAAGPAGADWDAVVWASWAPDPSPEFAARLGTLTFTASDLQARVRGVDFRFQLPALIPFAEGRCLLFNGAPRTLSAAAAAMQAVIIRVLASTPPGKARFTFVDPVGLGQNVADFMSLGDFDERLISGKAWTEPQHIEQQLTELTEHMEKVIQKYLRTNFATIRDYNAQAHEVAEAFRFLVVFDFPVSFSEAAARRLVSIVRNGPRCGVYTFVIRDSSKALPYGFNLADLEQGATLIAWEEANGAVRATWPDGDFAQAELAADSLEGRRDLAARVIEQSGRTAVTAMKVEVPFDKLLEGGDQTEVWQQSAAQHLRVPLGPAGARKLQYLTFGEGLAHHGLIVGRTGSGKSNLMHVMIVGLTLAYSPQELQLFLVDLKGGVGFKPYAEHGLPHAAVIAIESEREFGISVLQGLEGELQRRFELFRRAGVASLADFRQNQPAAVLPRILLVVDEFQELFSHDDSIAVQAKTIFDRMVRQGRSFGMHILLGTQSLAGNAQLPTSTMGQMAVRIALPCSDADARLILADDNAAARSLSRPGEAIYNAAAGQVEGNNPFQVAKLEDADLERHLRAVTEVAAQRGTEFGGIVFEGSEPARIAECRPLAALLEAPQWPAPPKAPAAWIGEPIAMLPPVAAVFRRQTGKHLLVVTREESEGLGVLYAAWTSLLCQHRPMAARFHVMDFATGDAPWAGYAAEVRGLFGHEIDAVTRRNVTEVLGALAAATMRRLETSSHGDVPVFLLIAGLHRARDLRPAPDAYYTPAGGEPSVPDLLATILRDGPDVGIHVLAWSDTVANARRTLARSLAEFGMRVAGAMSAEDSVAFLECSDAARIDRPHRLLFVDEERPGVLMKLRPYALPALDWLESVAADQRRRPHE